MTDEFPAKKKRRRRNRRRGSGGQAGPAPAPVAGRRDIYDEAANVAEIRAEQAKHAERIHTADELIEKLMPLITAERHKVVFDWLCQFYKITPAALITQIVRTEIARQLPNYREVQGGGGKSSRNLATLSERI